MSVGQNVGWPALRSWVCAKLSVPRVRWTLLVFRPRRVRHWFGGWELVVHLADPLGKEWYDHDWRVLPEIELLKKHRLKPGARVFNLGAHQCVVALMLAREVGSEGSVIALEANQHNAEIGRRNRELNRATQLNIIRAAVGETPGSLTFNLALNGQVDDGSGRWGKQTVPAYTIDELARECGPPDVLFMDIEGYECRALNGATKTLEQAPDCFVEMHVDQFSRFGGTLDSVLAHFPEGRYDRYIRAESDTEYVPFDRCSTLLNERFFLVALGRRPQTASGTRGLWGACGEDNNDNEQ